MTQMTDLLASTSHAVPPMLENKMRELESEQVRLTKSFDAAANSLTTEKAALMQNVHAILSDMIQDLHTEWALNHSARCRGTCTSLGGQNPCGHPRPASLPVLTR